MQSVRSWANQTLEAEATKTLFGSFATFLGASPDDAGGAELGWLFASVVAIFGFPARSCSSEHYAITSQIAMTSCQLQEASKQLKHSPRLKLLSYACLSHRDDLPVSPGNRLDRLVLARRPRIDIEHITPGSRRLRRLG